MQAVTLVQVRENDGGGKPSYAVFLYGEKVSDVYFNMRGYVGSIPCPGYDTKQRMLSLGECGITTIKKEIARSNKEYKAFPPTELQKLQMEAHEVYIAVRKEKQFNRKVELNQKYKQLQAKVEAFKQKEANHASVPTMD